MRLAAFVVLAFAVACSDRASTSRRDSGVAGPEARRGATPMARHPMPTRRDSLLDSVFAAFDSPIDTLLAGEDTSETRILALADSLARDSTNARAPIWLWNLGRLMRHVRGEVAVGRPETLFVAKHRSWFGDWTPIQAYYYNGHHFAELERRFPADTLADDAGYAMLFLLWEGECESHLECRLVTFAESPMRFAAHHPRSPFAPRAVRRATAEIWYHIDSPMAPYADVPDSASVRKALRDLDSLATTLPDSLRAFAYDVLQPVWVKWGNEKRASEIATWLKVARRPR